jgi:hypothetical protein
MHAVRHRDMDVPRGACPRKLRACGHLIHKKRFSLVTFLLSLLTKESDPPLQRRKLLILLQSLKASKLQSFKASKLQSFKASKLLSP